MNLVNAKEWLKIKFMGFSLEYGMVWPQITGKSVYGIYFTLMMDGTVVS